MLMVFWVLSALLCLAALGFVLPWIRSPKVMCLVIGIILGGAYGLYWQQGSSQYLSGFYSKEGQSQREKRNEFRILLTEFRKEEFRLKLKLEENSEDQDAKWRLWDLLAIKALYNNDQSLAIQYWEKAIPIMPENLRGDFKAKIKTAVDFLRQPETKR